METLDKNLLKEEAKRKILGEFYVHIKSTDKTEFIKAINGFINSIPTFKPIINVKTFPRYDSRIEKYVKSNDLVLLRREFFNSKLYCELADTYYNGNRLEIAVDKDGVKHMIIARNASRNASELSSKLGLETIRAIYKNFVYDVESLTNIIRELKEIKTFFENLTYPCYFKISKKFEDQVYIIHNGNFSVENIQLEHVISNYTISKNIDVKCSFHNNHLKTSNLEFIKDVYNEKNIINKEHFNEMVFVAYNNKMDKIRTQMNEMMNRINSI